MLYTQISCQHVPRNRITDLYDSQWFNKVFEPFESNNHNISIIENDEDYRDCVMERKNLLGFALGMNVHLENNGKYFHFMQS